jgi:hypothetical protein
MATIKMKIMNYEESSGSLIVTFASEGSEKSIDEYRPCAYQPTMFDTQDPEKVIENIARAGIFVTQQQEKEEAFRKNKELNEQYKQYIGKEFTFDVDELLSTANQKIDHVVQTASVVDEILDEIVLDEDSD